MNDIIRLLPDKVANQIAAGEVIQRPASVVKELVENAVDAGARKITVVIGDSGRSLIQCIDDGKGMSDVDARMSFERHATSKIASAADLEELVTMGFRGEALASIAAVARVEMRTRLKGHDIGTRLEIAGGHVESQSADASTPEGTNIMVKDLFFNVPARRKFLKKDSVEMGHISREFERLALVNPGVELSLVHNGVTLSSVRGGEGLLNRICGLFGRGLDKTLVAVATDTSIVKIDGFTGLPEHARRRGALQYLTVNGRNMKHPFFHKAIMLCYEGLIAADMQPNYFLNFTVEPSTIDVNIHPTKNEVKFENEQAIRQILVAAVREALGKSNAVPAIDFNRDDSPEIPVFRPVAGPMPGDGSQPGYNPFRQSAPHGAAVRPSDDWEKLFEGFDARRPADPVRKPLQAELDLDFAKAPEAVHAMQLRNKYILTPTRDGLMIIDQHRAHKRILYERYLKAQSSGADSRMASQRIMFGQVMRLTPAQSRLLETILPKVADSGFDLAPLGDNAWSILAAPPLVSEGSVSDMLVDLLTTLEETGEFRPGADGESLTRRDSSINESLALALAKTGAVRPGQPLGADEIERITSELMRLASPAYTPDGQRVFIVLTLEDIARSFG